MPKTWGFDDYERGACAAGDVGSSRPEDVEPQFVEVEVERIDHSPEQMVQTAIHALMRAASQTRDIPSSIKAAGMLLDRALGRVVAPAPPQPQAPSEPPADDGRGGMVDPLCQKPPRPQTLPYPLPSPRSRLRWPGSPCTRLGGTSFQAAPCTPQGPAGRPPSGTAQACQQSAPTAIQRAPQLGSSPRLGLEQQGAQAEESASRTGARSTPLSHTSAPRPGTADRASSFRFRAAGRCDSSTPLRAVLLSPLPQATAPPPGEPRASFGDPVWCPGRGSMRFGGKYMGN